MTSGDLRHALRHEATALLDETVPERILRSARTELDQRVGACLYEMARACLVEVPGLAERTLVTDRPEPVQRLRPELRTLQARRRARPDELPDLPAAQPTAEAALDQVRRCLAALEQHEGRSERVYAIEIQVDFDSNPDHPDAARQAALRIMESSLSERWQYWAAQNALRAHLDLEAWESAAELAERCRGVRPHDRYAIFSAASAHLHLGDVAAVQQLLGRLACLNSGRQNDEWWSRAVQRLAKEVSHRGGDGARVVLEAFRRTTS